MTEGQLEKRSLTIQGHRTSVALEPAFWAILDAAAARRGMATSALVAELDEARAMPLARALRLFALQEALNRGGAEAR
ncbi:ribbon-helix-helix domain-containing protein [Thermaurantiacus sp.]